MKKWFKTSSSRTEIHAICSSVESLARALDTKFRSSVLARVWDWTLKRPMHSAKVLRVDKSHSSAKMVTRAERQNL
ncbi:hypothetical protein CsSME_00030046 [Camellia sinensis var. sinensis]